MQVCDVKCIEPDCHSATYLYVYLYNLANYMLGSVNATLMHMVLIFIGPNWQGG